VWIVCEKKNTERKLGMEKSFRWLSSNIEYQYQDCDIVIAMTDY
jgi:hypothetical protein